MGEYPIDSEMKKALDVMLKAGWVDRYTSKGNDSLIEYTEKGAERIESLGAMLRELGFESCVETVDKDLLWQIRRVALLPD